MTKLLVVATGNPGKLREMQAYLENSGWELTLKPEELEIEETGDTFTANACLKASQVAQATGQWAIADDSGLQVDALDGAPGVYSARYGETDSERIARVLRELGDAENRQAQFVCVVAIASPDGAIVLQAEGVCAGEILHAPRGNGGFGYDPIFYVPEKQLTFAEMTRELKRSISHRGKAFTALLPQLDTVLSSESG
ncbi:RdgB/HAM1 family non-canonical purine NTP pyrophosphatase [Komarekiella sp. 'clone 1']|uniref:dITP/XTP pyrophosphatase n=1 Tax=Komarekiella delphini-convector SJRDD-AB1 TaxID=2593771 RepID=A0AA40VQ16_9NOST|nr:RdgB/HAM1 family non-canonical purine NTP pyrophosphatase [Komarekiella delphini-convector]MBD6615822.1 RdgB/HAM1 family non-canonical purine NTP pyrophosphatase [Komarekiella delphini-convector SJRDD-AB1]